MDSKPSRAFKVPPAVVPARLMTRSVLAGVVPVYLSAPTVPVLELPFPRLIVPAAMVDGDPTALAPADTFSIELKVRVPPSTRVLPV